MRIEYAAGASTHTLHLRQKGNDIDGTHQGDFVARDLDEITDALRELLGHARYLDLAEAISWAAS